MEDIRTPEFRKGPIAWMASHSVTANLMMLVLLIGGFFMTGRIKQEVFPDYDLDIVNISVVYPGASPEEVERGILLAVEEAVQGLEGVYKVQASASEGIGTVTVEIVEGENIQKMAQEIQNEVDRITSFPDEAEKPQVVIAARKRYVVSLALFGNQPEAVLREYANLLKDKLIQDPGVTQVELDGVRELEITIAISQDTLRTHGLTLEEVAHRVRLAAVELPAGAVKTAGGDVLVRIRERRDWGREFGKIPIISANDGTQVLLENLAEISDGFEEVDIRASYNGLPAVMLNVYRVGDQTPISVSDAVKKVVEPFNAVLPPGLSVEVRNDLSDVYRQRLGLLVKNGLSGLVLVFFMLALFLEIRLAFWVSLGIPVCFLGSLILIPFMDVSINMMSMFAFIITLGIVVDDAIVVGENIYQYHQSGLSWKDAAISGAREITMPVSFSVLTNMVTFVPMLFIPGMMGKIFRQVPIVVISVFAISLLESIFILPAHLSYVRRQHDSGFFAGIGRAQRRFSDVFLRMVDRIYGPFLRTSLRWRYLTMAVAAAILSVTAGYVQSGRLGFELFPKVESDYAQVTAVLPFGSAFEKTEKVQNILIETAQSMVAESGGKALSAGLFATLENNTTQVRVYLTPPDVRPISTAEVAERWRRRVGEIPGLESIKFESDAGGPGSGAAISVELSHTDIGILEKAGAELAEAMGFYPGVIDINDGFSPGKQQIDFKVTPEARSLGLTSQEIARQVRHAYYGAEALRQQRGENEVKVMVRLPKRERISEYYLEEMILRSPGGKEIPLRYAVDRERGRAYTDIDRRDGRRIITVTADVIPRSRAGEILTSIKKETLPGLQQKYAGLSYSFEGRQADQRESMKSLMKGLMVALVVIFAMLAIPLNSYIQPVIIMTAIPFGIVGAVIGHLLMGYSLSVISMFGVVALAGVVVNDSLVLIDSANRKRLEGMAAVEAICAAGVQRFRPILLTTITTFGGLAPMIFETSRQAKFLIPMAISLGFGVLFATGITLLLVPSIYLAVEDFRLLMTAEKGLPRYSE